MADNFRRADMVFHRNMSEVGVGEVYPSSELGSTLNVEFVSDGTFTAAIEVQMHDTSKWYPWPVVKMSTDPVINSGDITDAGYIYSVDTIGITAVRVNVKAVSGLLSVYGLEVG